jgi:hypothetical protein
MKIEEMADFLDGLASFTEKHLGKSTLNDIRAVSGCFRQFSGETVASFCNFITKAKEGKPARGRSSPTTNQTKVDAVVNKINHFLDNRRTVEYSEIEQIVSELKGLKLTEIKAISERVEGPIASRTKPGMIEALRNWMRSIKSSAEQSSFDFSGAGKAS